MKTYQTEQSSSSHYEDLVMKQAVQFFGEELLPLFGIRQKAVAIMPTESVYLEMRQMHQDFNFLLEDGAIAHFEFESDSIQTKDLRRFREYEAVSSRIWEAPVITYVVCSSRVRAIKHELVEGINPYRVKLIRLQDKNADEFFARMAAKKNLSKEDFVEMLLTPLMSGEMRQSVRIVNSIEYLKRQQDKMNESEVLRLQSMLYALANKFLSKQELENVKEVLNMTILGEMLVEKGREEGREEGIRALIRACTNLSVSRCEIISSLIREFSMTEEKAECYLEKYWTPAE